MKPAWSKTARTGKLRKYGNLEVFACEGLICIIDTRPEHAGDCKMLTPAEFQLRLETIHAPYRNQTNAEKPRELRQVDRIRQKRCRDCMDCVREAKAMGDPSDPKVQEFWARHKVFQTSRAGANFKKAETSHNVPTDLPVGNFTGRKADMRLYTPPVRKKKNNIIISK